MAFLREEVLKEAESSTSDPAGDTTASGNGKVMVSMLVIRVQNGDRKAFDALFEQYNSKIRSYLTHLLNNKEVAQELTQETFLKAWDKLPQLRSPASFSGWLYRIATNLARSHQRKHLKRQREIPLELNLEEVEAIHYLDSPEKRIENAELLQIAFTQVSLKYRPCLYFTLIEDLPQRKIAELLGIKETFVTTYIKRGMAQLRQSYLNLEGWDDNPDPGRKGK